MRLNSLLKVSLVLSVLFIGFGDRVLPQPMSATSVQARESVNQFLIKLFPEWQPANPTAQTEKENQKQEQKTYL